ncbi:MAG: CerR family C-terminal domain-containing protein [Candidatus Hydrogenedentes bacterium]|nr:CerR family C-terminal domain-containing protein [Candidatus Hydrogenedentota bacterium]
MNKQRRGEATKERVLEEACMVFAEKGYRDATHAEICRRAGTNQAAVNYYFSSKDGLYTAVFEHLSQQVERLYPLDGGLPEAASPEKRLHALIRALLGRMFDPVRLGVLHRIRMAEMFDPSGVLDEALARWLARDREHIQGVLGELLGPQAARRDIEWCELSVVSQCLICAPGPPGKGPRDIFRLETSELDRLMEHIFTFSLAGIKAIRRKNSPKAGRSRQ